MSLSATTDPQPELPVGRAIRRIARMVVVSYLLWVALVAAVLASGWMLPADAQLPVAQRAVVSLAVLTALTASGTVFGGWKAAQLALGRGRARPDAWTVSWLALFALSVLGGPLRLLLHLA